jgi:hypothetical protein
MGGVINRPKRGWESRGKIKKQDKPSELKINQSINNKIKNVNHRQFVSNNEKLVCFYVNARSIVYKMSELELYIFEEKPDIIGITESWTFDDLQNSELNINGYILLRKDRILGEKVRGGGVMLYIKSTLDATVREDLVSEHFPECIWCDVKIENEITLIGICYRCPSSNKLSDEALYELISKASFGNVMFMGDFNFSEIDWRKPETLDDSHPFLKCINDNFLIQHVDEPTRKKNILDLVFTSEENMIENLSVGEHFGTSDHQIIRWNMRAYKVVQKQIKRYNYNKGNYDNMKDEAGLINWNEVVTGNDVESDWSRLKLFFENMRDKYIPFKNLKIKQNKWITRAVIKCRRAKNKAWIKFKESGNDPIAFTKYKEMQKKSQNIIRLAKRNFEQKLAKNVKNDNKSFFAYVRSKQRTVEKVGPIKDSIGNIITNDRDAACLLNDYFSSVFTMEDIHNIPEPIRIFKGDINTEGLLCGIITPELVEKKLEKLNVNKCPGLDGIHPRILFELKKDLAKPLSLRFSNSLENGVVPADWKDAGIIPLFKKGKKSDPQNYRPISLTSLVCKILESLIKDCILSHLNNFSLIRVSQHGFTKNRSCLTNLLEFMEEVTSTLDSRKSVDIIYLDFAKAFDKVPYQRLLKKLISHGIGGHFLLWIQSWLTGRRQKVGLNGEYSNWCNVLSGVPQGSVLGPLLFLIYINDIDEFIVSKLGKFADDTKLCRGISNITDAEILRSDLNQIYQWSLDWQMLFNVDKCTVLHMGYNNKEYDYKLGNNLIRSSTTERDLGVVIDRTGKSSGQCILAARKANIVLGMIKRNISFKSKDVIVRLYKALVRPRLEFCVQAWCPYLRKDIDMIERVQGRATKLIEGFRDLSYYERLSRTGLISMEKRRVRGDLIHVFKMLKDGDKGDFNKFFEIQLSNRTRGHNCRIVKHRSHLDIRKYFFSQRVVNSWNSLPQDVIDAESVNTFKNRLDRFDKYFV